MKKLNIYTALLIAALGLGSCMNEDWQAPDFGDNPPYGNNEIIPSTSRLSLGSIIGTFEAIA